MIVPKACPRCGGDVDATYREDVYCVQCAHRLPEAAVSSRLDLGAQGATGSTSEIDRVLDAIEGDRSHGSEPCPRCGSGELVRLDKLRPGFNTCFRCRSCGHIFSPAAEGPSSITA